MIWRSAYIHDGLGPRVGLGSSWSSLVPDVLTDIDADTNTTYDINRTLPASLEVAVLIKDTVVGQVYLVIDTNKFAIMNHRGGIINVTFGINETNHDGKSQGVINYLVKRP
ncbi:hypothetical protein ES703_102576 [subsurface metagenome]